MKKTALLAFPIGVIFLCLTSCVIAIVDYPELGDIPASGGRTFHKVVSFNPGGTLALENENGDIEIRGWDENKVEVYAGEDIKAPYSRRFRFYGVRYPSLNIHFDQFEDFVKIKTLSSDEAHGPGMVHYSINVPRAVNLKEIQNRSGRISISDLYGKAVVDLEEGDVQVENFSGTLIVNLVRGSVQAELLDLRKEDMIQITTREGHITLFLQPDTNIRLEASAPRGNISSEFDSGQALPSEKIDAQIGEGWARVSLMALNGNISLKKSK
ncbi:MAG: DUF4097 family beta strand repeat-containing protein [Candidatus Aminicenantales bacterium]